MSETIQEITVVIGGETTALTNALQEVNQQIRSLQEELRQVDQLLEFDPSNIDLLAQRQELLNRSLEDTRERLNALREAQEQVNRQFQQGAISEGQFRAFQREVARTEQDLRRLEQQLEEIPRSLGRSMQQAGEKMTGIGDKMKGVGQKASQALTGPILEAGQVLAKGALEAQSSTSKLQVQLGLTSEQAESLGNTARDVWKKGFGESVEEVNNSIKEIRLNMGDLSGQELEQVAQSAMTIADIFDQDVKEITQTAGVAMESFGISGQDALDLIMVGFQKSGNSSEDLLGTIQKYAPQFSEMGIQAEQMLGALISGAQAGAWNMDKVGEAVKEFHSRAQDGSKGTAEGFNALGLDVSDMATKIAEGGEEAQEAFVATVAALAAIKDPLAQETAGAALFGAQWEDVRDQVVTAMSDGMDSLGSFQGATAEAAQIAYGDNPALALTEAMRELQVAIEPALMPLADIIRNTVAPLVKSLADWFTGLSSEGQKAVVVIVGIAAAIGPLLMFLGPIVSGLGSFVGAIGAVTGAIAQGATGMGILTTAFPSLAGVASAASAAASGLGSALTALSGPVGWAVAGIAALTVGGVALYKHLSQDALPAVDHFGQGVSEATQEATKGFLDMNEAATRNLTEMAATGSVISNELKDAVGGNLNAMAYEITNALEISKQESLTTMQAFLDQAEGMSEEEKQAIISNTRDSYDQKKAVIENANAEIEQILAQAAAENRKTTAAENAAIQRNQEIFATEGIKVLTDNEREQKIILERMKQNAEIISADQAAIVVKNSIDQKDKVIAEAEQQYHAVLAETIKQRDERGVITTEEADAMIQEAQRQKEASIAAAEETHAQVVAEAQLQAGEHAAVVDWETGEILSRWEVFKENSAAKWEEIKAAVGTAASELVQGISTFFSELPEKIGLYLDNALTSINQWIVSCAIKGKEAASSFIQSVVELLTGLPEKIAYILGYSLGSVYKWGQDLIAWVITEIPKFIQSISNFFQTLPEKIGVWLVNTYNKFGGWLANIWASVSQKIPEIIQGIANFFSELPGRIWTWLLEATAKVRQWAIDIGAAARQAAQDLITQVVTTIQELPGKVYNLAVETVQGLINGIRDKVSQAVESARNLAGNFVQAFKDATGISSPSKVMAELGRYMAEGLAEGMDEGANEVDQAAQRMAQVISSAVQTMSTDLANSFAITSARLDLQKEVLGDTATEVEKLTLEAQKLNAEEENQIAAVDILTAAYAKSKEALGETHENTKQYAHELQLAQIQLEKTKIAAGKMGEALVKEEEKAAGTTQDLTQELTNMNDEIDRLEEKFRGDMAEALAEYQRKVAEVNRKLAEDEAALTAKYEQEVNSRARSLSNFVGLFDQVKSKDVSGEQLLSNLRGQVEAFGDWQENIATLSARGIDEGLLGELREMGPKAGAEIAALNTLTDEQLVEYVALWQQKNQEAREEAIFQLEEQRLETEQKIQEIRETARKELERYRQEWQQKNLEIKKNTQETLDTIKQRFADIADSGEKYGISTMENFIRGIESKIGDLQGMLDKLGGAVDEYMPHSPAKRGPLSKIMEWGPALVGSLVTGIEASLPSLEQAALNMANLLSDSALIPGDPTQIKQQILRDASQNNISAFGGTPAQAAVVHYTQVINSPKIVDAYEADRLNRQASRRLALQLAR